MKNKYMPLEDYDYKMIEAYIDKPEVLQWYIGAFRKYNVEGVDVIRWHWSWWAFFGGIFYLLYRKAYVEAGVLFVLSIISSAIPFGGFVLWILTGGYATYFIYKRYQKKRQEVESITDDEQKRVELMRAVGGYNGWAIWVAVLFHLFFWFIIFSFLGMFLATLGITASSLALEFSSHTHWFH